MTRLPTYLFILLLTLPVTALSQHRAEGNADFTEKGAVSIGLLLPDQSHYEAVKAAKFAIERANAAGGYLNRDFELVVRTAEGFWGAGSKESVSLVYEDRVRAIIGSLDGRNGHLAEQVATKSHLSYVETYATEPTLSQAFVPWFMRVVPSDKQQAETIIKQVKNAGGGKIGILSADTYDTRYAVRSLTKAAARYKGSSPLVIELDTSAIEQRKVIEMILRSELDHLVIPFDAPYMNSLIITLEQVNPELLIYGTLHLAMAMEKRKDAWKNFEGLYLIAPAFNRELHSALPDMHAAYIFDAVMLVVNAIQQVGTDRKEITEYMSGSEYRSGVTGNITFDALGNRKNASTLIRIEKGIPQIVKH